MWYALKAPVRNGKDELPPPWELPKKGIFVSGLASKLRTDLADSCTNLVQPMMKLTGGLLSAIVRFLHVRDSLIAVTFERLHRRRLCRKTNALLALVPTEPKRGEVFALHAGGSISYVVRPCNTTWELVGDVYVHRMLYGEPGDASKCVQIEFV